MVITNITGCKEACESNELLIHHKIVVLCIYNFILTWQQTDTSDVIGSFMWSEQSQKERRATEQKLVTQ
jgi:hypothetical protein